MTAGCTIASGRMKLNRRALLSGSVALAMAAPSGLSLAQTGIAAAEKPDLGYDVGDVFARKHLDLGGTWRAIVDPLSIGDESPIPGIEGWSFRNARPFTPGLVMQEYDFARSRELRVPGDWTTQSDELRLYGGPVWLHRRFDHRRQAGRLAILHFGAVSHFADVYLNGTWVGRHEGGFTPFQADVTALLREGANDLVVKTRGGLDTLTLPTRKADWLPLLGITREVLLLDLPKGHILRQWARLDGRKDRRIRVSVETRNMAAGTAVRVDLPELRASATGRVEEGGRTELLIDAPDLKLWSPATPRLYELVVTAGEDRVTDQVGFRRTAVIDGKITLNGKPIFLKGVSSHEVSPRHDGRAYGPEDAGRLMADLRALGANFVRLAHYCHNEWVLRAADAAGIIVWSEIPVYWGVALGDAAVLAKARRQLSDQIARDRNRCSIVLWSIANETVPSAARNSALSVLADDARRLDGTRLVTAALFASRPGGLNPFTRAVGAHVALRPDCPESVRSEIRAWLAREMKEPADDAALRRWLDIPPTSVNDPVVAAVDVVSVNEYYGWYTAALIARVTPVPEPLASEAVLDLMRKVAINAPAGKPLIVSEFGGEAKAGFGGNDRVFFSERYQAELYRRQFELLAGCRGLAGMCAWTLTDFRSPLRLLGEFQDGYNRKGLQSETGQRKLAFSELAGLYRRTAIDAASPPFRTSPDNASRQN